MIMETTQPIPQTENGCQEAYQHYHANSYGYSEWQETDFKAGYNEGYNKGYQEAILTLDQSRRDYKERVKHYFVSFMGVLENGYPINGCQIISFKNATFTELSEHIRDEQKFQGQAVILNLRELSQYEFEMLNPQTTQDQ